MSRRAHEAHYLNFCAGLLLPPPHILSSAVRCKHHDRCKIVRDHWRSSIVLKTQAVPPLPPSSSTSKYTPSPAAPPRSARRPLRASTAKIRNGTPLRPPEVLRAQSRADHWSPYWLAPCRAITPGSRAGTQWRRSGQPLARPSGYCSPACSPVVTFCFPTCPDELYCAVPAGCVDPVAGRGG